MQRLTITAPTQYNDGRPIESIHTLTLESMLVEVFGGYTRWAVEGAWKGSGTFYREPMNVYALDTDDPSGIDGLRKVAAWVRDTMQQEAVHITAEQLIVCENI